jgi:glycosyltransferase involved in cell wall biosynthesis
VPNGINVPTILREEKELNGIVKLLYLSNLVESKGYLDLLHAVKLLKGTYEKEFQVTFCGKFMAAEDDRLFKNVLQAQHYFEKYVNENDITEIVKFKGVVWGQDKEQILNESHFIILPSFYISEGQPISLIEGLAYGCVPVCTHYRDLPNIVKNDWNGIIVKQKIIFSKTTLLKSTLKK